MAVAQRGRQDIGGRAPIGRAQVCGPPPDEAQLEEPVLTA